MPIRKTKKFKKQIANLDPSMEHATERLVHLVWNARNLGTKNSQKDRIEALEELCRFLRASKVLLRECMESYPSYYDHFEAFIEQALAGCSLAEKYSAPSSLRKSLNRHAQEIESLRAIYKELHAADDSDGSVGEMYSGARIPPKSRAKPAKFVSRDLRKPTAVLS